MTRPEAASGVVGLVPARAGSKRVPGKNVRPLCGHPLVAYTIAAALQSGVFGAVVVSTDSEELAAAARHYGAETPGLRPPELAGDHSPDVDWVRFTMERLAAGGRHFPFFAILRPTSPLRSPETIRRAWVELSGDAGADSLRAVERCRQHPGKMWRADGERMIPLLDDGGARPPWHSRPYQSLPEVLVQNASLEIARARVLDAGTIAGVEVRPFRCPGHEGFDVNDEGDWVLLERLVRLGEARLPEVGQPPWIGTLRR